MKQLLQKILYIQGFYFILLGLWPILSIDSFMAYTGQKTDIWLVRTFGAMLACEGLCFVITGILKEIAFPMLILAFFEFGIAAVCGYALQLRQCFGGKLPCGSIV